jgi:hypothetical protein
LFQVLEFAFDTLQQGPFLGQRAGQLQHFHRVKRFLENHQPVGAAQLARNVVPRIVRIGRAQNDLDVRVHLPNPGDGLDAIPAGRHPHIDKRHGKRFAGSHRFANRRQSFISLKSGGQVELRFGPRHQEITEQLRSGPGQVRRSRAACFQNLPEVGVDGGVVINDEHPPVEVGGSLIHGFKSSDLSVCFLSVYGRDA